MASIESDVKVINDLGGTPAMVALGYSEEAVRKWFKRGIPWSARYLIRELATKRRVKLPANFADKPSAKRRRAA
jgi:hypothetical protein